MLSRLRPGSAAVEVGLEVVLERPWHPARFSGFFARLDQAGRDRDLARFATDEQLLTGRRRVITGPALDGVEEHSWVVQVDEPTLAADLAEAPLIPVVLGPPRLRVFDRVHQMETSPAST